MPSFPRFSYRSAMTARAHGRISFGSRSAAMLRAYFGEYFIHSPERSGLPSGVRGAGAVKFGLPSAVRGMPGVGCVSHWAASGVLSATVLQPAHTSHRPHRVVFPAPTATFAMLPLDLRAGRALYALSRSA